LFAPPAGSRKWRRPTNRAPEFAIGLPRLIGNGVSLEAASYHVRIRIESLAAHQQRHQKKARHRVQHHPKYHGLNCRHRRSPTHVSTPSKCSLKYLLHRRCNRRNALRMWQVDRLSPFITCMAAPAGWRRGFGCVQTSAGTLPARNPNAHGSATARRRGDVQSSCEISCATVGATGFADRLPG
jgi:hypothetical protein